MNKIRNGLKFNSWEEFNNLKDVYLKEYKTGQLTFADTHFYKKGPNVEKYEGIFSYRSIKCTRHGKPSSAKSKKTDCLFHMRGNHDPNTNVIEIKSHNLKHNHPLKAEEDEVLLTYPHTQYLQVIVQEPDDGLLKNPENFDGKKRRCEGAV